MADPLARAGLEARARPPRGCSGGSRAGGGGRRSTLEKMNGGAAAAAAGHPGKRGWGAGEDARSPFGEAAASGRKGARSGLRASCGAPGKGVGSARVPERQQQRGSLAVGVPSRGEGGEAAGRGSPRVALAAHGKAAAGKPPRPPDAERGRAALPLIQMQPRTNERNHGNVAGVP